MLNEEEFDKEEFYLNKISNKDIKDIDLKNDILVSGIDNIKVTLAHCCRPVKGDQIIGYISRGNGVIVHNKNCHNLKDVNDRLIDVSWNNKVVSKYKTTILIISNKQDNLLLDVITKSSGLNINIVKVDSKNVDNSVKYKITIEVENIDILNKYIRQLKELKDIVSVERIMK